MKGADKSNKKSKNNAFKKSYGAFESTTTADEIAKEIRGSRSFDQGVDSLLLHLMRDAKNDETISVEDFRKEIKNWK